MEIKTDYELKDNLRSSYIPYPEKIVGNQVTYVQLQEFIKSSGYVFFKIKGLQVKKEREDK